MKNINILFLLFCLLAVWQQQSIQNDAVTGIAEINCFSGDDCCLDNNGVEYGILFSVLDEIVEDQDVKTWVIGNRRNASLFQSSYVVLAEYRKQSLTPFLLLQHYTNLPPPAYVS
ncbi:hypothetical protein [uncultured Draconibacterium sp.]|uniref:hypothetical protein n=1 Tax=uncultured Draconibacterium sp. TaxID=1573823 RepID=UPI0032164DFA